MLARAWNRNGRLRRALVASLAVHALVAAFIPIVTPPNAPGLQPVREVTFVRLRPPRSPRPHTPSPPAVLPHALAHASVQTPVRTAARPLLTARPAPHSLSRPALPPPSASTAAPAVEAVKAPVPPTASPMAAPSAPAASAPQALASAAGPAAAGLLPLGADLPVPVLDPHVRAQLTARFNVRVTLIVTVGDDGRTKRVEFHPPLDPQTEAQIRRLLADANWDPAVCGGGIACQGIATIKL